MSKKRRRYKGNRAPVWSNAGAFEQVDLREPGLAVTTISHGKHAPIHRDVAIDPSVIADTLADMPRGPDGKPALLVRRATTNERKDLPAEAGPGNVRLDRQDTDCDRVAGEFQIAVRLRTSQAAFACHDCAKLWAIEQERWIAARKYWPKLTFPARPVCSHIPLQPSAKAIAELESLLNYARGGGHDVKARQLKVAGDACWYSLTGRSAEIAELLLTARHIVATAETWKANGSGSNEFCPKPHNVRVKEKAARKAAQLARYADAIGFEQSHTIPATVNNRIRNKGKENESITSTRPALGPQILPETSSKSKPSGKQSVTQWDSLKAALDERGAVSNPQTRARIRLPKRTRQKPIPNDYTFQHARYFDTITPLHDLPE